MNKLNITLILVTIVVFSLAIAFSFHRKSQAKMRENDAVLHRQVEQLNELVAEQQRLRSQVAEAMSSTNSQSGELAKLRSQAQILQKQTNELGAQLQSNRQARASQPASKPVPRSPEYYQQLHRTAGAKGRDAKNLVEAFILYALDHQGHLPSTFEQVAPYVRKRRLELSGTNQFEIIYHGTLDELKGVPRGAVVLIRDKQTWIAPSGKKARVYGLANGVSQIVESDDDFKSWEAEHIISSAPGGR